MRFWKPLGHMVVAAAALMASTGTASATTLTSPPGTIVKPGTIIHAVSKGHAVYDSAVGKIECNSTLEGKTTSEGGVVVGVTQPVEGSVSTLTFTPCTAPLVKVLKPGTLKITSSGGGKGTLVSNGTEVTVETFGIHCVYSTNGTTVGTVTGGSPAVMAINGTIPRTGGSAFCGSSAPWTGTYEITKPNPLIID